MRAPAAALILTALAAAPTAGDTATFAHAQSSCGLAELPAAQRIAACGRALENPGLSDLQAAALLSARGEAYLRDGAAEAALGDCTGAIALAPFRARYFVQRGDVREKLGQWDAASNDFAHADSLHPGDAEILLRRAQNLILRPNNAASQSISGIEFAARSAAIRDSSAAHATLAAAFARNRDYDHAIAEQRLAVALAESEGLPTGQMVAIRLVLARLELQAQQKQTTR